MGYPRKQTVYSKVKKSFTKFKADQDLLQLVVEPEVSGGDVKPRKSPVVSAKKQQIKANVKPKLQQKPEQPKKHVKTNNQVPEIDIRSRKQHQTLQSVDDRGTKPTHKRT